MKITLFFEDREKIISPEVGNMEAHLKKNIKDLIDRYPPVANILDEYGIGCVPCSVGTCQLIDVVDIHNLPREDERKMMESIAGVIYPGRIVPLPEIKRDRGHRQGNITYSPPMKRLVDEHVYIKRWAELIPEVASKFDFTSAGDRQLIFEGIDFIRSYADRFHHAKEEDILFKYFDGELDIIKAMNEDHRQARGHVKSLMESLENNDSDGIATHLQAYGDILREHVNKEDEILYPWMDRNLTISQVGELFSKFNEVEKTFGEAAKKHEAFVKKIEIRLNVKEVTP
jgi:hemerythrin-like domain-containing protein